jgi:hypothetical protein
MQLQIEGTSLAIAIVAQVILQIKSSRSPKSTDAALLDLFESL